MNLLTTSRIARLAGVVALSALVAGCSRSGDGSATDATLSGAVQLSARLYDSLGAPTGERVVTDADGVRVRLSRPGGGTDSAVTHDGRYSFAAGAPGVYRASCTLVPEHAVATPEIHLERGASGVFDALTLGPVGDVRTYPNPVGSTGVSIEFEAAAGGRVEVTAYALSGDPVWRYSQSAVQGLNHIHWMITDDSRAPLPAGAYWVAVRTDGRHHYNLVFKP